MVNDLLHDLTEATKTLRSGLTNRTAHRAAKNIRNLLEAAAVAIGNDDEILAYVGSDSRTHASSTPLLSLSRAAQATGKTQTGPVGCDNHRCDLGEGVAVPIRTRDGAVAALVVITPGTVPATVALVRAATDVAQQLGTQLDVGLLDRHQEELRDARLAALRSQMSPHFMYNTMTAIASMVRTDPERARELLFRFAELSRYIQRNDRTTTTLAEELRIVHVYFELERARKGDSLEIIFRVDPSTLHATVPMVTLQPLVENAVQHGLDDVKNRCVITVEAQDRGHELQITVRDDGKGMDRRTLQALQSGEESPDSTAIRNVRARLEAAFGTDAGIDIDSSPGEGTSIRMRIPRTPQGAAS
jgi:two-component system LytT family sensor kinase